MKTKFKKFLKRVTETINRPEMRILPGQLAFFFVLSMIPLIALMGTIAGQLSISIDSIEEMIQSSLPKQIIDLITPVISAKSVDVNLIIFYISAFLLASNGTHSMIIASNSIYKVEDSGYLNRRIKALIMTIILVLLLIFVVIVPAFGDTIIDFIIKFIPQVRIKEIIETIYQILKYPISIILIYMNIKLLYTIAPDKTIKSKETTYGAMVTTIGWIITTEIYSVYTNVFAHYDLFYGSISNILILLLWVYILAYIFVLGMALNSSSEQEKKK